MRSRVDAPLCGVFYGLAGYAIVAHALCQLGTRVPAWLLPLALAAGVAPALRARRAKRAPSGGWHPSSLSLACLCALAATLAALVWGSVATPDRSWDGFVAWSLKARVLASPEGIAHPWFQEPLVFGHSRDYPLLQPLCLAATQSIAGLRAGRLLFPALWCALALLVFASARRAGLPRAGAVLATCGLALAGVLVNPGNGAVDSGYAEVFCCLLVTAAAFALLHDENALLFCAALCLPLVKPEGLPYGLALVAAATLAARRPAVVSSAGGLALGAVAGLPLAGTSFLGAAGLGLGVLVVALGLERLATRARFGWRGRALLLAGIALAAWGGLALLPAEHMLAREYLSGLERAGERLVLLPEILLRFAGETAIARKFGLLFPLLLVLALAPRRLVGRCPSRPLALFGALGLALCLAPFLLSPEPELGAHMKSSLDRLLTHWVGAVALLLTAWLARDPSRA